jgi:hypothetical protein
MKSQSKSQHISSKTWKEQFSNPIQKPKNKTKQAKKTKTQFLTIRDQLGGVTIPDLKLYYRERVIKTTWYW